ncbi:tyrosine-type recombinase/integrase [Pengzhenrongella sp.]|jgi:integrase/recombinase XerD|uniref:tyrosine-type recombinase/integrase n=1 Tax=Pengzhenrongella sp. TaxID=2888820 RepID=UPI002F9233AF
MTETLDGGIPLVQAVEEYLDWQALDKARSPNTVRAYKQDLGMFVGYAAGLDVTVLGQVDRELLRAFQSDLARGPGRTAPLSASTRHRRLVALRSFLKFCAREQWSPGDLGVTIDLPKLPRRLPKPLAADELARVTADVADGVELDDAGRRDRALVAFLISTGARISEALGLDRADWNSSRVIVRGKGDVERTVVITDRARTEIDRYLDARTDPGAALFVSYSPGQPGRRLSVRGAEAICARLGAKNNVTKLHPHRFRHTAGTIVQDELGDPLVTADYLGHHGLGSVSGYAEVSSRRRQEASEALKRRGL